MRKLVRYVRELSKTPKAMLVSFVTFLFIAAIWRSIYFEITFEAWFSGIILALFFYISFLIIIAGENNIDTD